MYWTVYDWRQLISGESGSEKSWQKLTKNWGAGAGFKKSWRQQDQENSVCWKYMKMLKNKLKTNQIQVITGDNCLEFSVFSMCIPVHFQVPSTNNFQPK